MSMPEPTGGALVRQAVTEVLAPIVVGADSDDIVGIWDRMYQESLLIGCRGGMLRAISAVDIALWDLLGKRAGLPLAVLLGGSLAPVEAYASGGYYRHDDGHWTDSVRAEILANRSLGFRDHKIKVGGLPVAEDAARVAAAVEAMEGQGRLAVDANNAYRNPVEALAALRSFERSAGGMGLWWFEEPLSPDDVAGHAYLRKRTETAIATGEIAATRWDFRDLIEREAADILQIDAGVLGGITEYARVASAAETFGTPLAPHWHANLHVHLAAAHTNCMTVEHFSLDKDIYNFEVLLLPESRLTPQGGRISPPDTPGIGIALDEDVVRRFTVLQ
jgi:L-alanine-DL-glutamate epimerase-like enolase superfamily enzyme